MLKSFSNHREGIVEQEFIRLFHLYKNDVYRLAFSYTKNCADADDITQNVFIKLYRHLSSFQDDQHLKKWLIKVTVNECKTLFLSAWKKKVFPLTEREENVIFQTPKKDDILPAVLELPKKDRLILHLYYYENYRIKEIAKILSMSETSIQTRLSRSREKLKVILKEEYYYEG